MTDFTIRTGEDGVAVVMGHPLGAAGTLLGEFERQEKGGNLATLCIASGMGAATIIERV